MSYVVSTEVINDTQSQQTYIGTGISENIELSHRAVISPNGNAFLVYTYTNESGQKVVHTEWPVNKIPREEEMSPKQLNWISDLAIKKKISISEMIEVQYNKDVEAQMKRIINVAKQFVPVEELTGNFKDFYEFVSHVSSKIGGVQGKDEKGNDILTRSEKLRVKFVYDNKGFVNTPQKTFSTEPWIERMDAVSADQSKINILPTDQMIRAAVNGSRAPQKDNPLEDVEEVTPPALKEDMPF